MNRNFEPTTSHFIPLIVKDSPIVKAGKDDGILMFWDQSATSDEDKLGF
jgi:hypothetical protein